MRHEAVLPNSMDRVSWGHTDHRVTPTLINNSKTNLNCAPSFSANAAPPQTDNTATTAAHQCRIYLHQNTTKSPTTTMPRQRPRTSNKQMDRTDLEKAFNHRVQTECSHKEAAEKFGVKKTTLVDAFNRSKKEANGVTYVPVPGKVNMVFTPEQEGLIVKYTIQAAQMFYGLHWKRDVVWAHRSAMWPMCWSLWKVAASTSPSSG
ncbi:hypothetical protein Pmani_029166 [Petrolisthes manimaculis]|uniref:HTH psq-type domain-containing protein n=1 Tax=Petrolisthes manimaculis TaxID=1843537 RepID=A0AAE1TUU8_9EUCA|nr:hypothetical protein Pmani_029166 [Petrolisthes manimaculis]